MRGVFFRLYSVAFLLDGAAMLGFTVSPFFIFDHLGGGPLMSGTVGALQSAGYAVACMCVARWAVNPHTAMRRAMIGCIIYSLCFSLAPAFRSPVPYAALTIASIVGMALVWPALQAWFGAEPDPYVRARRLSGFQVAWSTGMAVGPVVGGPLYDLDYRLPYAVILGLGVIVLAIMASLPHEEAYHARRPKKPAAGSAAPPAAPIGLAHLRTAWLACGIANSITGATSYVFAKRVAELNDAGALTFLWNPVQGLGPATQFSLLIGCLSLARAATFGVMGRSAFWHGRFSVLLALQLATGIGLLVMGITHSLAVMLLCCLLTGINAGAAFYTGLSYSIEEPLHKNRRAAINEVAVGSGGFLGCLLFGLAGERFGTAWTFRMALPFILCAIALEAAAFRFWRRRA